MRTTLATLAGALALVVLAQPAIAKGATGGTLAGDGVPHPITLGIEITGPDGLVELTGLYAAVFGSSDDSLVDLPPTGALGRHLIITWTLEPGPPVRQDLYPDAAGGPLVYTKPGSPVLVSDVTRGGWYRAAITLRTVLDQVIARGTAAAPVTAAVTPLTTAIAHSDRARPWPVVPIAGAGAVVSASVITARARRRRMRPVRTLIED